MEKRKSQFQNGSKLNGQGELINDVSRVMPFCWHASALGKCMPEREGTSADLGISHARVKLGCSWGK